MIRARLLLMGLAPLLAGCVLLMPGDPGISLYALNRTDEPVVIAIGQNTGQCYGLAPGAFGEFVGTIGHIGDFHETIRIFTEAGDQVTVVMPDEQLAIYIFEGGDVIQHRVAFDAGTVTMRVPAVPEADGRPAPGSLPKIEHGACNPL